MVALARRHYGSKPHQSISHGDFLGRPKEDLERIAFVSGHFGYDFALPLMQRRYSFTFLRDPVERLLSFYYFCRSRNSDDYSVYRHCRALSLGQALRAALDGHELAYFLRDHQAWMLACGELQPRFTRSDDSILAAAVEHLTDFDHVGFTETFEKDQGIVCGALGIALPSEPMIENAGESRPRAADLPADVLTLAHRLTALDRELYQIAWSQRWPKRPLPTP